MNLNLSLKFAYRNVKANYITTSAFILSSSIMLALLNILATISKSDFVVKRQAFKVLMNFGVIIIGVFTIIFILYSSSSMIKKRNKELALYGILGLEKKHILKIVFMENTICYFAIIIVSSILSYIFGNILFLTASKVLKETTMAYNKYSFSPSIFGSILAYLLATFVIIFVTELISIKNSMPIELINKSKRAEKEPKSKVLLTILGLILLITGYTIALITKGNLKSLGMFFAAALIVLFATYILYTGLSIILLKRLRNNKRHYYKKISFITISSIIYRMKRNATGLASVTVLLTALIITMATSTTIYRSIETALNSRISSEYSVTVNENVIKYDNYKSSIEKSTALIAETTTEKEKIQNLTVRPWGIYYALKSEDEICPGKRNYDKEFPCFIIVETLDWYNEKYGKNISLGKNEIMLNYNSSSLKLPSEFIVAGKKKNIKELDINIPSTYAVDGYRIVVPTYKDLEDFDNFYMIKDENISSSMFKSIKLDIDFDIEGEDDNYLQTLKNYTNKINGEATSRGEIRSNLLEIYGGVLFTGIVLSILFLIGTTLIIYYKQVFEGYDDRDKFQIMKKVGLEDSLIKKSTSRQILWLFFTPLLVALIHTFVASKIVYQLLGLFNINSYWLYMQNVLLITLIIAIVYFIIFKITSRIYYRIIVEK